MNKKKIGIAKQPHANGFFLSTNFWQKPKYNLIDQSKHRETFCSSIRWCFSLICLADEVVSKQIVIISIWCVFIAEHISHFHRAHNYFHVFDFPLFVYFVRCEPLAIQSVESVKKKRPIFNLFRVELVAFNTSKEAHQSKTCN